MCGPADFEALNACITRLAGLSAAGVTAYSVCKTVSFCRELHPGREEPEKSASPEVPGGLAAEGSSGQSDT